MADGDAAATGQCGIGDGAVKGGRRQCGGRRGQNKHEHHDHQSGDVDRIPPARLPRSRLAVDPTDTRRRPLRPQVRTSSHDPLLTIRDRARRSVVPTGSLRSQGKVSTSFLKNDTDARSPPNVLDPRHSPCQAEPQWQQVVWIGDGHAELEVVTHGKRCVCDQKESRYGDVPGDPGTPVGLGRQRDQEPLRRPAFGKKAACLHHTSSLCGGRSPHN